MTTIITEHMPCQPFQDLENTDLGITHGNDEALAGAVGANPNGFTMDAYGEAWKIATE